MILFFYLYHMRSFYILFVFLFCSSIVSSQKGFVLKDPDTLRLKQEHLKSDYGINTILSYLERNYKSTSVKTDIKLDPEFNNEECGFTKKFEFGIVYTLYACGEAAPSKEKITFPKVKLPALKKWVELIYAIDANNIKNKWYPKENEYGPDDEEAGCYYKLKQIETQSVVDVWCGC